MNVKRPFTALMALVLLMSFAAGPAAAVTTFAQQDDCTQANSQGNIGNANIDTNVNAGNIALNIPVLSPNTDDGDQSAEANQVIRDSNDDFQSQTNVC